MDFSINKGITEGCDKKSRVYCDAYNTILPLLVDENDIIWNGERINVKNQSNYDLSALGLYLGKYLEQEINCSIVQLMRLYMGVDMPDYYCKLEPLNYGINIETGGKRIYLNKCKYASNVKTLMQIPLGDAYYALETLIELDPVFFSDYPWMSELRFKELWRNLLYYRNQIAHCGSIVRFEDFKKNLQNYKQFMELYMPKIFEMKKKLAPDGFFDCDEEERMNNMPHLKDQETETDQKLPKATDKEVSEYLLNLKLLNDEKYKDYCDEISEKLAKLMSNYDWMCEVFEENAKKGLKDVGGKILVPANYDDIGYTFSYFNRLYSVPALKNGKLGLVSTDGQGTELTPFVYDYMHNFEFSSYYFFRKENCQAQGILSVDGKEVVSCVIDEVYGRFGSSVIYRSGERYGLMQTDHNIVIPPVYNEIILSNKELEDPLVFVKNGVEGYVRFSNQEFVSLEDFEKLDEDAQRDIECDCICEQYTMDSV